jgi:hypothetical protein
METVFSLSLVVTKDADGFLVSAIVGKTPPLTKRFTDGREAMRFAARVIDHSGPALVLFAEGM